MRAYVRLVRVRIGLRTRPFSAVGRELLDRSAGATPAPLDAARVAAAVAVAARYSVPRPMCLPRSLVLASMLLDLGHPARLRIGVRRADDALQAHAWVESDGAVVGDRPDVADLFRPLGTWSELPEDAPIGVAVARRGGDRESR